jgi:hypothetical protein
MTGSITVVLKIMTNGRKKIQIRVQKYGLTSTSISVAIYFMVSGVLDLRWLCTRYFLKFEKYVARKGSPPVDTSLRGSDGPIEGERSVLFAIGDLQRLIYHVSWIF